MANQNERVIRRHKRRSDDGKGIRRLIADKRFRVPAGVSSQEADQRFLLIERLWRDNEAFCARIRRQPEWTYIALWAADQLKNGVVRIPLPPTDDILCSYWESPLPIDLRLIIDRHTDDDAGTQYPPSVDGFESDDAKVIFDILCEAFPCVNWILPEQHAEHVIKSHEKQARWSLGKLAQAKNQAPPDPSTPLISGTFHEALTSYEGKRRDDFTTAAGFDSSGYHMVGLVRQMQKRMPDFPLAELDFSRCQTLFDFWRDRPEDPTGRDGKLLSKKTCQNYVGELGRFLDWLHLTTKFGWRKPVDFESLKRNIRSLPCDRKSLSNLEIETFTIDELAILLKHATLFERFLLVWCLNCAHGAAEMGRVEWGDLVVHEEHPWKQQGLKVDTSENDSWCGFIRPKSGVLGWWLLWPETVRLLEWWKSERRRIQRKEPSPDERVLITKEGNPLYRDESGNAQSGFANAWNELLDRIKAKETDTEVRRLPFGTLRNQLPDWLGGEEGKALIASVALCHGIPHKGDKLLFKHYSNKPWAALFQSQREYRQHLASVFDVVPDLLVEHDPLGDKVLSLWKVGIHEIPKLAQRLDVSEMTVRRRLDSLRLKPSTKRGKLTSKATEVEPSERVLAD